MLLLNYILSVLTVIGLCFFLLKKHRWPLYNNYIFLLVSCFSAFITKPLYYLVLKYYGIKSEYFGVSLPVDEQSFDSFVFDGLCYSWMTILYIFSILLGLAIFNKKNGPIFDNLLKKDEKKAHFSELILFIILLFSLATLLIFNYQYSEKLFMTKNAFSNSDLSEYSVGGPLRTIIESVVPVLYFAAINISNNRRASLNWYIYIITVFLLLFYYFSTDQRSGVLGVAINILVSYNFFIKKVKMTTVLFVMAIVVFLALYLTINRLGMADFNLSILASIDNYFGLNGIDILKTVEVVKKTVVTGDYLYGKSLLDGFLIMIPRSIWVNKDIVNLDTVVGFRFFGAKAFGAGAVAPGLVGEAYLNFGVFGILFIIYIGIIVGFIESIIMQSNNPSLFIQILYLWLLAGLAAGFWGSGFSNEIAVILTSLTILFLYYKAALRNGC